MKEVLKEIPKCLLAKLPTPSYHLGSNFDSQNKSPSSPSPGQLNCHNTGQGLQVEKNTPLTVVYCVEQKTGQGAGR